MDVNAEKEGENLLSRIVFSPVSAKPAGQTSLRTIPTVTIFCPGKSFHPQGTDRNSPPAGFRCGCNAHSFLQGLVRYTGQLLIFSER